MKKRKNKGLRLAQYLILFVGLTALYLLFGLLASTVSDKSVSRHVQQTEDYEDLKADFWFAFLCKPNYFMDNFTDALIVNQAMCQSADVMERYPGKYPNTLWNRLMLVPRLTGRGEECESLRLLSEGATTLTPLYYARYWHGSTYLMRILLSLDDYVTLRGWFYILSSLLLLWVVLALARRVGAWAAVLYSFAWVMVNGFMMQFSIQYLPVLLLALAGSLWVIYGVRRPAQLAMLLFVLGSLTAYFDLLTAPLITWGVPLLVWFMAKGQRAGKCPAFGALFSSAIWFVGYAATWGTKWLLATLTTPMNVFADATREVSVRTGVADFSRWDVALHNLETIHWLPVAIAAGVLVLLALRRFNREGWRLAVPCLLVAAVPIVWYMVLADHSYLHYWFTYRSLAVTVMGLLFALACMVDWRKASKK